MASTAPSMEIEVEQPPRASAVSSSAAPANAPPANFCGILVPTPIPAMTHTDTISTKGYPAINHCCPETLKGQTRKRASEA